MKKHAVVTACDRKYGDFLVRHWLRSLQENVCLDEIDILVLDYGLTESQRKALDYAGVVRRELAASGFVNNIRFRDLDLVIDDDDYDQLLLIDSGDIIFQADISSLFEQHKDSFRAVVEQRYTAQYEWFISTRDFEPSEYRRLVRMLKGKRIINVGMILGPASKMKTLWGQARNHVQRLDNWGTLQLVINFLFHRKGFVELPFENNFILCAADAEWRLVDGQFLDGSGKLIPVVHNAGKSKPLRFIANFGYGPGFNRRKFIMPALLSAGFRLIHYWRITKQNASE